MDASGSAASGSAGTAGAGLSQLPRYLAHLDSSTLLPTAWSTKDKLSMLELSHSNLQVDYKGPGKTDQDAASIRANHPIPSACGIYYYEVEVVSKGRDGYMGIGLCWDNVQMNRLPGWEPNSYGYHGDDGHSFNQSGSGRSYGPTYTTGDVVGCGINFLENHVFYTKNGIHLGVAFRDIKGVFYPTIGMRTAGEVMRANFGQRPFVYDIDSLMQEAKAKLRKAIASTDLPAAGPQPMLSTLVLSYLIHHGYGSTAAAFAMGDSEPINDQEEMATDDTPAQLSPRAASLKNVREQLASVKERQNVKAAILEGNIDVALDRINQHYPGLLEYNHRLLFQLRCRKFIELVYQSDSLISTPPAANGNVGQSADDMLTKIMAYGQQLQQLLQEQLGRTLSEEDQRTLEEAFSLLAYVDVKRSPVAHLLGPKAREAVASQANKAILLHTHQSPLPPLERLLCQLLVTMDELVAHNVAAASLTNVREEFL